MSSADSPSPTSVDGTPDPKTGPTIAARALPWLARVAWILVAVIGGSAIESAVDGRSDAVRWTTAIGAWFVFAIVAIALLIPAVVSLTVIRVGTPLAVVAAIASAIAGSSGLDVALLLIPAGITSAAVFTAEVGRWMVQATAYGDEDRLPLRSPVPAGTAAVLTWIVWAAAVTTGPLALAAENWPLGIPVTLVALVLTVFVGPRWYSMTRRWLVLVPAGLVVHDPLVLADTLMVRTDQILGIGLARADTQAADLTGPASGYAVQVDTTEPVSTVFAFTPKEPNGKAIHMTGFLVAPSRPGEALRLASARNLPIR
ncbi:hypothetical protein [Ilumatobacter nonamiensis]|uniref:hypothetical protein n=1 Tax=Ilumatobacter nonamiensis TaxID=467093 RepID=UPI000345A7CE|nr:hypothetical protein [Ilumatobacter nonamiensis]